MSRRASLYGGFLFYGDAHNSSKSALALVRFDHVASFIVNANHGGVSPHPTHYSGVGLCLLRGQVEGYGLKFFGSDCEYIVY